jgi:integrative and conjugative element protein (TIGR02256 family)
MLNISLNKVWFKNSALETMLSEINYYKSFETGGCLIGYNNYSSNEIVITSSIGPGPNARHTCDSFTPDHAWQLSEIAKIYRQSKYIYSYLGDWHTHPENYRPALSRKDMRTLKRIAKYPPARMQEPIMAIIAVSSALKLKIWCLEIEPSRFFSKRTYQEIDKIIFCE